MKKPPSFRRFLLVMVFLLESLSLAIVISFLFAMLDRSMKQEIVSQVTAKQAELRLYISDRLNYTRSRVEEIRSNNNIRISLLIGMHTTIAENLQTLFPPALGSSFYVRSKDGRFFPKLSSTHTHADNTEQLPVRLEDVLQTSVDPHTLRYSAAISQKDQVIGHAVGIYDMQADQNCLKLLAAFQNLSLVLKTDTGWMELVSHRPLPGSPPRITETGALLSDQLASEEYSALGMGIKEFPSLFLNLDNNYYRRHRRSMVTKLVLLCIPIFFLTYTFSFLIIKRVTFALDAMAKNALHIAGTDAPANLDTANVRHAEFLNLAQAFNTLLAKVREQTDDLKNANKKLRQQSEERRLMAQALQESESQLRSLQNNIPIGLFRKALNGPLLFANPKMVAIFGYDSEKALVQEDLRRLFHYPQQYDHVMEKSETSDSIQNLELRFKRKGGAPIWCSIHLKKSYDPNTGEGYIDGAVQDITDRKKIEAENQKLETQLRQAHKMEALGTLAGGIAHDFNNILFAINGFCELAIDDSAPGSDQYKNLQEAIDCLQLAAELVRQILIFARQADVEDHPLNLTALLKENLKLLRATLPTTIKIQTDLEGNQTVRANPTQIHQIIINLCTNATHAMREKGGVLSISLNRINNDPRRGNFDPRLKRGLYARLRVKDSGHGLKPETMERIFDPYFTTKAQGEGTGMGLSVVQGIVTRLGGIIHVESTPGRGAVFDIFLPALEAKDPHERKDVQSAAKGNEHILFVDDDTHITQMLSQLLSALGYQLTSHNNPEEALETFRRTPENFDMVISDVTMPQMNGYDFTRELLKIRPDLPVVLCTGYSKEVNEEAAYSVGARALFHKPVSRHDLATIIRRVINGPRNSDEIPQTD